MDGRGRDERGEDPLVRREEEAASAEAGEVGGPVPEVEGDEADRPVEEGGGGVAEGFETAERELTEQASHGEDRWEPEAHEPIPEDERDTAAHGEADEIDEH